MLSHAAGIVLSAQQTQTTPVPKPFPGPAAPPVSGPAAPPAAQAPVVRPALPAAQSGAPTDEMLGGPGTIYPSSDFLESFELDRGQRCYLFGTNSGFAEVVAYYKQTLRDSGRELFKTPAMQQFDLGRFQDQSMSYPPSVVVKDYASSGKGYLHVDGTTEKRFRTIIQIVPAPGR
jgi:hypothetical protein